MLSNKLSVLTSKLNKADRSLRLRPVTHHLIPIDVLSSGSGEAAPLSTIEIGNEKGFLDCIEHPIKCIESEGDKILQFGSKELSNLESDLSSAWKDVKNGFSDITTLLNNDFNNFKKFVSTKLQSGIISGLETLLRSVLKKVGSFIVGKINTFQTEAQNELSKVEAPIMNELKSIFSKATSTIKGLFSSSSTAADLENEATSSAAESQTSLISRTIDEVAETDATKELENVIEDTVSTSNIKSIIGKSVDLGVVFAVVDIGLLSLGYPIVVFEDRSQLKSGDVSKFETDFVSYYEYAIFNTFKNVVGDFLSYFVSAISASISTTVMAAIDVATLGLGALPSAAIAFILNFIVSMVINLVLSAIISLSFKPFYNMFWNANGGLESDVSALAAALSSSARALASK